MQFVVNLLKFVSGCAMFVKILDRGNGDWVFLAYQMVLACIMGVLVYITVLCDGSAQWGIAAAALAVLLGWLINEGLMVKYISALPEDEKAPEEEAPEEEPAKVTESWISLRKKYHTLDDDSHVRVATSGGRRSISSANSVDPVVDSVETTVIPASEMQAYIERLKGEQEG